MAFESITRRLFDDDQCFVWGRWSYSPEGFLDTTDALSHMNIPTCRRAKRRTALAVLLTWMFAIGASWGNACLLQERSTHVHPRSASQSDTHSASPSGYAFIVSPGHAGSDSVHDADPGTSNAACLKFCNDGTQTVVKVASTFDVADVVLAPPTVSTWRGQMVAAAAGKSIFKLPAPSPRLPLRTRFSRLAL